MSVRQISTRRSARRIISRLFAAVVTLDLIVLPAVVFAATPPAAVQPAGNTQGSVGTVIADDTLVRCGADASKYYATNRLAKGDHVTLASPAVGDWLPIVPPAGSFCYVVKSYVTKNDNNTVTVSQPDIRIRAGSTLVDKKLVVLPVLTPINVGDTLQVVGEEKEYFKIVPPSGAYFWVEKASVDMTPPVVVAAAPVAAAPVVPAPVTQAPVTPAPVAITPAPAPTPPGIAASAPMAPAAPAATITAAAPGTPLTTLTPSPVSTQPADTVAVTPATTRPTDVAVTPTTAPSEPTAQEKFDAAEAQFASSTKLPLEQQPIDSLTTQYTLLSSDSTLAPSEHRIVSTRLATLQLRGDAKNEYVAAMKMKQDADAKRLAQKAEQDELAARIKEQQVTLYAAVGTLRTSSLAQSGTTLYRICDPTSGHTMLYVRTNDPKYAGLLNQFVGIKGDVSHDDQMNIKVIAPTGGEAVDQSKVGNSIGATLIPPSMAAKTVTASAGH